VNVPSLPRTYDIGLRATVVLSGAVYVAALGGSKWLGVSAGVLDGVPLCLGSLAILFLYGRLVPQRAVRAVQCLEAASIVFALGLSLACLSYLGAMMNLPLRDREMIWIDRHLGFDWLQAMKDLDRWPAALDILDLAYATFTAQLVATVLILLAAKRTRDLDRFFVTFLCASLVAELASVFVPTLGPMSALAGDAEFVHLPTLGRTTADIVLALRDGTLKAIDLDAINGIISFPSMHAAVAVIVPYTLRWNRTLFWPFAALDAVMLASAVPSGNHYLVDVVGGVAVAGLAIACGPRLQAAFDALLAARVSRARYAGTMPAATSSAALPFADVEMPAKPVLASLTERATRISNR
jgi:membrane-associated phospholipid phosphatase